MPHGYSKTTTFIGALRLTRMTASFVHDGAMNGTVFLAYVEQVALPTLQTRDIVTMDNLPAQKQLVRAMPSSVGGTLMFLPPIT